MESSEQKLQQVGQALARLASDLLPALPQGGWIRTVREALGMNARQLAARVGVRVSTLLGAEKNEVAGTITMNQLKRIAAAMDCELRYVLIPREPLRSQVERRAEQLANEGVASVAHSMAAQAQDAGEDFWEAQIAELKAELLRGRRSRLWD